MQFATIDLPCKDWVALVYLLAKIMPHMTKDEVAFCVRLSGQIRYQTIDQTFIADKFKETT